MSGIDDFVVRVREIHASGQATEHSYRAAIEAVFASLGSGVRALNEPRRTECGAPDFLIQQDGITIGHCEAKDVDEALERMTGANKEQQERYLAALPNLIYTNCLTWIFYRDGERTGTATIAELDKSGIRPQPERYKALEALLADFVNQRPQTITTPQELAERMAGKAGLIKEVLGRSLYEDRESHAAGNGSSELHNQYLAFKEDLIPEISEREFADIYAETVAYGMFAARLHAPKTDSFSRRHALDMLPKSNPFLRSLFGYIAGHDLDRRIAWIIDDLAQVFAACDIGSVMDGFGELSGRQDPFLHFYETFLTAYDPARRKACGVWYTPEAVVNFIVRSVDEILQREFGLSEGLADTSKVTIDADTGRTDNKGKTITTRKQVHRVQILDPAAGTGTFLAEVIKQIAPKVKHRAPAVWSQYIEQELIPRLHGFELLMASYAMCHTKIGMVLSELGYKPKDGAQRLSVYLTDSLQEGAAVNRVLPFAQWLSREAEGANTIKRDMPIMCIIGNPPYLGEAGKAKGWIGDLMEDYKKQPGGREKLRERNPKWLNDLYVRFIRMSSHLIEKNGEGVLGFITNHGYLDNPTFRGMRWHLLKTFDKIYVLNLHGNAKEREAAPDGGHDENIFDIQQGVAIIIAIKKSHGQNGAAELFHGDLWGKRDQKYENLYGNLAHEISQKTDSREPHYVFVPRDYKLLSRYENGFSINDLMPIGSVGIITARDSLAIHSTVEDVESIVVDFASLDAEEARHKYSLGKDTRDWKVHLAQRDLNETGVSGKLIYPVSYRPFDTRYTYYTGKTKGFICMPRNQVMPHLLDADNFSLTIGRQGQVVGPMQWNLVFAQRHVTDCNIFYRGSGFVSPLYAYPAKNGLGQSRHVNFAPDLYAEIQMAAKHPKHGTPNEVAVFDYIYGVLHCPGYRETYADFLEIDFPRIPWPKTPAEFWSVSRKGTALRKLHLMDPDAVGKTPYPFKGEGDATVDKPHFDGKRVWVNKTHYFDNAPETSWNLWIGGYQPAQKWLKDRKGRPLSYDDIQHYQRILKILSETARIMRTIKMTL